MVEDVARLSSRIVSLDEVLADLPSPTRLTVGNTGEHANLLITCLGFEERGSLAIDRAATLGFSCDAAVILDYARNVEANHAREHELLEAVEHWTGSAPQRLVMDGSYLGELATGLAGLEPGSTVVFDITCASNPVICSVIELLLHFPLATTVMYGEAATYAPSQADFSVAPGSGLPFLASGTADLDVHVSQSGEQDDTGSDVVVIIPGFDHDRARKVISFVDSSLLLRANDHIHWLLGVPHLEENAWRLQLLEKIHDLSETPASNIRNVSTFDYRAIWRELDELYESLEFRARMNVSPMGSKMQAVGCALFFWSKSDVRVVYAIPESYSVIEYSAGLRDVWTLRFGDNQVLSDRLLSVGEIEVFRGDDRVLSGRRRVDWD